MIFDGTLPANWFVLSAPVCSVFRHLEYVDGTLETHEEAAWRFETETAFPRVEAR